MKHALLTRFLLRLHTIGWVLALGISAARSEPIPTIATPPLRVAINHGNAVLAQMDKTTGQLRGVSVDMAQELGKRLGVEVKLIGFDAANKSVQALRQGAADVGFFAVDPQRSQGLLFTAPYVVIEGAYVVPQQSPIKTSADVDQRGIRVAVAEKSAYDLYLTRALQHAQLIRTTRSSEVVDLMLSRHLDVAAGVRQQLEKDMQSHPDLRLLQPGFMQIEQAMATSGSLVPLHAYLQAFVEQLKASGFIRQALQRHQIEGVVAVAPAAAVRQSHPQETSHAP